MGADKKFFGKNSAYDPKSNPRILHTNSSNHQDHVVTTDLPILRMILERWEEAADSQIEGATHLIESEQQTTDGPYPDHERSVPC